jgi:beta-lactamase regulating signal transducer with metallopeptidase domain
MIVFGLQPGIRLSHLVALVPLNATMEEIRTRWFIESIVSAALIVLVVRSRRPFYRSRLSGLLTFATFAIVGIAVLVPIRPPSPYWAFNLAGSHPWRITSALSEIAQAARVGVHLKTSRVGIPDENRKRYRTAQ